MNTLRDKIHLILKQLAVGGELKCESGHTLVVPEGYEEPGFKVHSSKDGEMAMQIGSETAWMFLIDEAKRMTREDCMKFIMDNVNPKALANPRGRG